MRPQSQELTIKIGPSEESCIYIPMKMLMSQSGNLCWEYGSVNWENLNNLDFMSMSAIQLQFSRDMTAQIRIKPHKGTTGPPLSQPSHKYNCILALLNCNDHQ